MKEEKGKGEKGEEFREYEGTLSTFYSSVLFPIKFIAERTYNADQIRFLRAVQNVFLQKRRIEIAGLYDEPLDRFGEDAVERWFTEQDVQELLALTERLAA